MPFVDAHRYLKVQDQDLNDSFNNNNSKSSSGSRKPSQEDAHAGVTDKYSKASFESFELEPTRFDAPKQYKKYLVSAIFLGVLGVLLIVGLVLFFVLIVAKNMGDAELGFDENGDPYLPIGDA